MITLLSDFGLRDAYVATMKGTIAQIAPRIPMCDITHLIPPQDILAARFNLRTACSHFPSGSVHLAVVDPGVGSSRRAIAFQTPQAFFVGPDNGIFDGILESDDILCAVTLTNSKYWRTAHPSNTFHGRDIFAPVSAHLANGVPIRELGDRIQPSTLTRLDLPPCIPNAHRPTSNSSTNSQLLCTGSLQYIDGFGNLISNIPQSWVPMSPPPSPWEIQIDTANGPQRFPGVSTYSDVPVGTLAALVGSHGWVEVACNSGSAQNALRSSDQTPAVMVGTTVSLRTASP